MPELLLYECAALRARITEAACARNHRKAEHASRYVGQMKQANGRQVRLGSKAAALCLGLECCVGCPGVVALAKGQKPNVVDDSMAVRAKAAQKVRAVIAASPMKAKSDRSRWKAARIARERVVF